MAHFKNFLRKRGLGRIKGFIERRGKNSNKTSPEPAKGNTEQVSNDPTFNFSIASVEDRKENIPDERVVAIADNWLKGNIVDLGFSSLDTPEYTLDSSLWEISNLTKNQNTFYLFHYGLRGVYWLSQAFELTGDERYLQLALAIVGCFADWVDDTKGAKNEMVNNDHAIAERIENVCYLSYVLHEHDYEQPLEFIGSLVKADIEKLLDPKKYQKRHNHGIIADKACLVGISFLNESDLQERLNFVQKRLMDQVVWAFGTDGVHRENSTDYHFSTLRMLLVCVEIAANIDSSFAGEIQAALTPAIVFARETLKPDGRRPLFGDSKGSLKGGPFSGKLPASSTSDFSRSEDEAKSLRYFPSGYYFINESESSGDKANATWISLKCGYSTRVHKHKDDLSLCLYSQGEDIFLDPGMQGYMPKDPFKDYMESVWAHTTIGIKNQDYSIASGNSSKIKGLAHRIMPDYDYCCATSSVYEGIFIYRHLYFVRSMNVLVIRDELRSDSPHTYVQLFHLGLSIMPQMSDAEDEHVPVILKGEKTTTIMSQMLPVDQCNVTQGAESDIWSFVSTGFGASTPSYTLAYEKTAADAEFITVVDILDGSKNAVSVAYDAITSTLNLERDSESLCIEFEHTIPPQYQGMNISIDHKKVRITSRGVDRFAVYLYDQEGTPFFKTDYVDAAEAVELSPEDKRQFFVMMFLKGEKNDVIKGLAAKAEKLETGWHLDVYDQLVQPVVKEYKAYLKTEQILAAEVNLDYPNDVIASWWLYRNGALKEYVQNHSLTMEWVLDVPGDYVAMCSLQDKFFGEFFFTQFDLVTIA